MASTAGQSITVLGAGSWGTALAVQFARAGSRTTLWGRDSDHMGTLARDGQNLRYLPGALFPKGLHVESELSRAVQASSDLLIAVPSHAFRGVLEQIASTIRPADRVAWATKGFELTSGLLPHQVAEDVLGRGRPLAVLSGPTFAKEVGAGLPTAMTVASSTENFARELAVSISAANFRAYTSSDIIGVEVGGATKNVIAIAAGISDGLGFGANTRIAVITRGLLEMTRLGQALGAQRETFMGLAGMGDLVLTCTDDQSRNRRAGLALGAGKTIAEAKAEIRQVIEGFNAARAVHEVASHHDVEMPISEQVYRVIHEKVAPAEAVRALMTRALKSELD